MSTLVSMAMSLEANQGIKTTFLHPGMLYTKSDLDRMKEGVASKKDPWITDWQLLQSNTLSRKNYTFTPTEVVYRNDTFYGSAGNGALQNSASAALLLSIEWAVTNDISYANSAINILNSWSDKLKSIEGKDAQLAASLYGYKLLNSAEILRYTNSGWSEKSIENFTHMMEDVFYPLTKTYGKVNNGWANGNWDAADTVFNLSLGVWLNDATIYNSAVDYFKHGEGNGSVIHYVQNFDGQLQESGRDQAHAQGGLGLLISAAQIGVNQGGYLTNGADMVSYPNKSYPLMRAAEYTAKYNLGYYVPYTPVAGIGYTLDDMNKGRAWIPGLKISELYRGEFRPIYQTIFNLFTSQGISESELPYTKEVIYRMKIGKFYNDHPSYEGLINATKASKLNPMYINLQSVSKYREHNGTPSLIVIKSIETPVSVEGDKPSLESGIKLVYLRENIFSLFSTKAEKYLTVDSAGKLSASADSVTNKESFRYIDSGGGNGVFRSIENDMYLTLDPASSEVYVNAKTIDGDNTRWIILYPDSDSQ